MEALREAVKHDWWVIAGYTLVLSASCAAFGRLAFSGAGKKTAPLLLGALGAAILADVAENFLVLYAIDHHAPRLLISVAATIKWVRLSSCRPRAATGNPVRYPADQVLRIEPMDPLQDWPRLARAGTRRHPGR